MLSGESRDVIQRYSALFSVETLGNNRGRLQTEKYTLIIRTL